MSLKLWSLEYILEVAKTGSISRAAQNLFLSQPHLSNTIKGVESELGITLFRRSAKGMALTEEGELFVRRASRILAQVDELEHSLHTRPEETVRLGVSVTRSYQINRCVTRFLNEYSGRRQVLFHVRETNPFQVMEDVRTRQSELGVLHFFDAQQEYFLSCFKSYSLCFQEQYRRPFLLAMSRNSPLAGAPRIEKAMLAEQLVVLYGDYEIPPASYQTVAQVSDIVLSRKRVYVYERATAMETLSRCPNCYMWITGLHPDTLRQYGLVLRRCEDVHVDNLGYSLYWSGEPLSPPARALLERMEQVDWTEEIS